MIEHILQNISIKAKSLFVTLGGSIFVDNGENNRIEKWSINTTSSIPVETGNKACYGLFIDLRNTIYCSARNLNEVIKKSLNTDINDSGVAAGNGSCGSALNQLCHPHGIFVDTNFTLYVADTNNSRIQRFSSGNQTGITILSNETVSEIRLRNPTGIVLDADENMFIVDERNLRIIRWKRDGSYSCLVGCPEEQKAAFDPLKYPRSPSFDSYGNIYVADMSNGRIQKFILMSNVCGKYTFLLFSNVTNIFAS